MSNRHERKAPLESVFVRAGGVAALAEHLGVTYQAVAQWDDVPARHCVAVHLLTGVPLSTLRPDLYPPDLVSARPEKRRARAAA